MSLNLVLIMSVVIAATYWLEENTKWIAHISGVILIIIVASALGGSGIVPSSSEVYDWLFKWMAPFGIALMLLAFRPKLLLKINSDFILCFFIGVIATAIGGIIAGLIFRTILPADYWRISGQLTASFIGGYENAVSVGTGLHTSTPIFLKVFAGDSTLTALWIIVNIFQGRHLGALPNQKGETNGGIANTLDESIDITSTAITISTAFCILAMSAYIESYYPNIPQIIWVSLFATLVTFTPLRHRFVGSYVFGSFILSYFIFGCGAISNVSKIFSDPTVLLLFPATIVLIHALILFSVSKMFHIKKEVVIITSQCLIGGPATALAVVAARRWDYQLEAISLGLLGYTIGNYVGFGVAWILN